MTSAALGTVIFFHFAFATLLRKAVISLYMLDPKNASISLTTRLRTCAKHQIQLSLPLNLIVSSWIGYSSRWSSKIRKSIPSKYLQRVLLFDALLLVIVRSFWSKLSLFSVL